MIPRINPASGETNANTMLKIFYFINVFDEFIKMGLLGVEPRHRELQSRVLPLNYSPPSMGDYFAFKSFTISSKQNPPLQNHRHLKVLSLSQIHTLYLCLDKKQDILFLLHMVACSSQFPLFSYFHQSIICLLEISYLSSRILAASLPQK